ncbi:H-X9-DG-CTERM domain-containing protein [Cerasicoccus frondis]|uniref:H-X9-DG-CTERM domain-containing protein n=1 Tax=Cerasicoccus frondis TaxID=490090 RepID=UPI002852A1FA|nr:H-X9-DG-CTERM domain-containing protein [Cerasicoccus frondis]
MATNPTRKYVSAIADPTKAVLYGEVWHEANTVFHSLSTGSQEMFLDDYYDGRGSNYVFVDGHVEFLSKDEVTANNSELMKALSIK